MFRYASDVSIFSLTGEVDRCEGGKLLQKIHQLLERQWVKIVLDLGEVEHIHYKILPELLQAAVFSQLSNGGIKLVHVNPYHRRLLELVGVHENFETYDSVAAAILSFGSHYSDVVQ